MRFIEPTGVEINRPRKLFLNDRGLICNIKSYLLSLTSDLILILRNVQFHIYNRTITIKLMYYGFINRTRRT